MGLKELKSLLEEEGSPSTEVLIRAIKGDSSAQSTIKSWIGSLDVAGKTEGPSPYAVQKMQDGAVSVKPDFEGGVERWYGGAASVELLFSSKASWSTDSGPQV